MTEKRNYVGFFRHIGLDLVGWEQVQDDGDSTWYSFPKPDQFTIHELWSQIAYSAHLDGKVELAEIARSLSFSLTTAGLRMRDICREYAEQNIRATTQKVAPGRRFANVRVFELYMALHAFLAEICSARDYLAQFVALQLYEAKDIRTMTQLYKFAGKSDTAASAVRDEILRVCDQKDGAGWMARLSKFRNLIMHEAPMNKLTKDNWLTANTIEVPGRRFYQIYLGVPRDPIAEAKDDYIDALDHFRRLMTLFFDFARMMAAQSGITPKMVHLTDADLKPLS